MSTPKLEKMLALLCEIEAKPRSSVELARDVRLSEATVSRLVADLRHFGCLIRVEGGSMHSRYVLDGWGVFNPDEVKRFLGVM